ncbi:hypothetical protein [Streptomyces sp. ISL-11]|uniref:hypothetical protein n=1 Tax=Streptomyces sp. ISL-11 TaxID=2819174 RepID=UPI001BE9F8CD|nr:hypothetical protein [Streptomyces sp. ISL-11]MBT2387568.1 hypothetical protein [Streptomyces sp. ISL-11]
MNVFAEAMRQRIRDARTALAAARAAGDAYETAMAADELDDALWLARRHGIDPDGEAPVAGPA